LVKKMTLDKSHGKTNYRLIILKYMRFDYG